MLLKRTTVIVWALFWGMGSWAGLGVLTDTRENPIHVFVRKTAFNNIEDVELLLVKRKIFSCSEFQFSLGNKLYPSCDSYYWDMNLDLYVLPISLKKDLVSEGWLHACKAHEDWINGTKPFKLDILHVEKPGLYDIEIKYLQFYANLPSDDIYLVYQSKYEDLPNFPHKASSTLKVSILQSH